jgi:hypothetical protein
MPQLLFTIRSPLNLRIFQQEKDGRIVAAKVANGVSPEVKAEMVRMKYTGFT